jgi:hypothetical protein
MTVYESAFGSADATLRLMSVRIAPNPRLYLTCTPCQFRTTWRDQFLTQLQKHLIDASIAADIVQGIQNWFLTGDKNEPYKPDHIIQIGWSQVLGYLPHQRNILQAIFFRTQGLDVQHS